MACLLLQVQGGMCSSQSGEFVFGVVKHAPSLLVSCRAAEIVVLSGDIDPVCIYCSVAVA